MREPIRRPLDRIRGLRPRWAWVCLLLGLPSLVLPLGGCLRTLSGTCLVTAGLVLGFRALVWLWLKLLFKVSRRLWVILLLVTFLPALTLTVCFLGLGWLGLGAQVTRSIQGHLSQCEAVLREADAQAGDTRAIQYLKAMGQGSVTRVARPPSWIGPGFRGLVYDPARQRVDLRLVAPPGPDRRLLVLDLDRLSQSGRALWGGRLHCRVDVVRNGRATREDPGTLHLDDSGVITGVPPLATWSEGGLEAGSGILRPFRLPPLGLRAVDWETGRPLVLTLTPETSLKEIFMGYGFSQGNRSIQAFLSILLLCALAVALGILQLLALLMGLLLARNLGKSVDGLFKGVARLSGGDFSVRIRPRGQDQVGQLTRAFNDMAQRLQTAAEEREERLRLEEELRVAREVQMRLLPDMALFLGCVQATILPAREVAGDYFDLLRLEDGRLAFLIADVSGKGTSAAFYAAQTKGVLAALDKGAMSPLEVASRINAIWCRTHPRQIFMTLIYGLFDPRTGDFSLVRAGHPPAFLRRADGRVERLAPRGLGIGLSPHRFEAMTELCRGRLETGDSLICYTDGLSEAQDPQGAFFGEPRLETTLALPAPEDPQKAILGTVAAFTDGRPLEDDLTLLILRR